MAKWGRLAWIAGFVAVVACTDLPDEPGLVVPPSGAPADAGEDETPDGGTEPVDDGGGSPDGGGPIGSDAGAVAAWWIFEGEVEAGTEGTVGDGVAITPEGTTVLLQDRDVITDYEPLTDRDIWALELRALSLEGNELWSRRLGIAPSDTYSWDYQLVGSGDGLVIDYTYRARSVDGSRIDFGCGKVEQPTLIFLDFDAQCVRQYPVVSDILTLSFDEEGNAYTATSGISGEWGYFYVYAPDGTPRFRNDPWDRYPYGLTYRRGELVAVEGAALVFLTTELDPLRTIALPAAAVSDASVSPDGRIAVVVQRDSAVELEWGTHTVPPSLEPVLLTVEPDGSPGMAVPIEWPRDHARLASDAQGVVVAVTDAEALHVRSFAWDGAVRSRTRLPFSRSETCGPETDCARRRWLSPIVMDSRFGIRISGTISAEKSLRGSPGERGTSTYPARRTFVVALPR